ncbi:MAG: hypothetical protein R2761_10690 [Acidimicrobiales bacterium]
MTSWISPRSIPLRAVRGIGPVAAALTLALSACSIGDTPEGVAEKLIEGELADQLSLGDITATCEKPPNRDVGTTFTCTSPTEFGEIEWTATMADAKTVNVQSDNLVTKDVLPQIETAAASSLSASVGAEITDADIDCGPNPVVLADDLSMVCALTDPGNGAVYDTTLTFTDLQQGAFDISIAEEARS